MKSLFLILNGILIELAGLAYQSWPLDSIIEANKNLISFNIFDTLYVCTYSKPQLNTNSYIVINNRIFDTLSRAVVRNPVYIDNNILFNSDVYLDFECKKYKKFMYSVRSKSFYDYNTFFLHDNGYNQLFSFDDLKLYIVHPLSAKKTLFVDFTNYMMSNDYIKKETDDFGNKFPLVSIEDVFFLDENEAIVSFCKWGDFEGCYGFYYFYVSKDTLFDVTNTKLEIIKDINSPYKEEFRYKFDFIS